MINTFKKEYKKLSENQEELMDLIKDKAENLLWAFNQNADLDVEINARRMAIAKTNLEQAVMWAIKAILD